MIEIQMTGVVASEPKERDDGRHPTKTCVRVNVVDAQGRIQWMDCRSTNPSVRELLSKLRIGDAVQIAGHPAWCYYTKSDGRMQGLQARVTVRVVRRLGSTVQHQPSKEHANA